MAAMAGTAIGGYLADPADARSFRRPAGADRPVGAAAGGAHDRARPRPRRRPPRHRAPGGLVEKDLTLDIAQRLRTLLEAARFEVLMTRDSDATVALQDRAAVANAGARRHLRLDPSQLDRDRGSRGVETYYLGPTDDPFITRLAARREPRLRLLLRRLRAGCSTASTPTAPRGVAAARRGRAAAALRARCARSIPRVRDRGVKTAPFLVLVATGMPAILAEVSCLSNAEEARCCATRAIANASPTRSSRGIAGLRRRRADSAPSRKEPTHERPPRSCHVGIDLGTSRSSISASNGARHVVDSFVGWPVDMVARKVLKRQVLIGARGARQPDDARPAPAARARPDQGGLGEGRDGGARAARRTCWRWPRPTPAARASRKVRAVVGVPAEALRVNKQHLRNAMKGLVDSLMIVSEPFAVAYGMDALLHTLIIDIGAGTTDFCVMKGRYPTEEDQRTLTAGRRLGRRAARAADRASAIPRRGSRCTWCASGRSEHSFVGEPEGAGRRHRAGRTASRPQLDITDRDARRLRGAAAPIVETMLDLHLAGRAGVPGAGAQQRHPVRRRRPDPRASVRRWSRPCKRSAAAR